MNLLHFLNNNGKIVSDDELKIKENELNTLGNLSKENGCIPLMVNALEQFPKMNLQPSKSVLTSFDLFILDSDSNIQSQLGLGGSSMNDIVSSLESAPGDMTNKNVEATRKKM